MGRTEAGNYWQPSSFSRRRLLGAATAGAAGGLLASCDGSPKKPSHPAGSATGAVTAAAGTPRQGGVWRQATLVQAPHFSPFHPGADASFVNPWRREFGYYERLWDYGQTDDERQNKKYHLIYRLAESSEQVDPTTVIVKLKQTSFHNRPPANGRPVTAGDVAAVIEFLKHPPASGGAFIQSGKDLKSVTAIDDHTLRFELFGPRALFYEEVNAPLLTVPKEMLDEQTLKTQPPIGNGPYMFKSSQQGSREEAERNPTYYLPGRPYPNGKLLTFLPDLAAIEAAFRAGQIDDIGFSDVKQAQSVTGDLGNKIVSGAVPSLSGLALLLNIHRPPFNDARVREAIYRAVNVQSVIDTVWFGAGRRSWYFSDAFFARFPIGFDAVKQYVDVDPQKAADLFKAAGVDPNHSYDFIVSTESQPSLDAARLLSEDLGKVGLKTRIVPVPRNIQLQRAGPKPGDFDLTFSVLLDYVFAQTHSGTFWDCTSLEDPEVDALVARVRQTVDNDQRAQFSHQFETALAQKYSPLFPLLSLTEHYASYSYMKGISKQSGWQSYQPDRWIDKG
ncbi:MAG: ABC transporter substrate-binding protein [Dehalococcoidia bacterium]